MTDTGGEVVDPQPAALEAAAEAFAATRTARRLLDGAGQRGAAAVNRSRPIPGARRASIKAQTSLEESALKLEEARDRFAALMRGIAVDLEIETEQLVDLVEQYGLAIALEQLEAALLACREAAAALATPQIAALDAAEQAVRLLRERDGKTL
ncbi:MAG TPA: hypothetical protein VNF24_08550 [Candidatus Acidoferrales bacterium]|nr:hypothetical protein [Candidatus Acidoferrales bacterium]